MSKKKAKGEIFKQLEPNKNENAVKQNLWDAIKAVPRGKFITTQVHHKEQRKQYINNSTLHLQKLEKEQQKTSKIVEGNKS